MFDSGVTPEERKRYLTLIERRAVKLAQIARDEQLEVDVPDGKDYLLARHIHLIVQPAIVLMPDHLRAAFLAWFIEQVRDNHGMCTICGTPKLAVTDLACQDCLRSMREIDDELGLDALTADALRAIAREPDARD